MKKAKQRKRNCVYGILLAAAVYMTSGCGNNSKDDENVTYENSAETENSTEAHDNKVTDISEDSKENKIVIRVDGWDMEYTISDRKFTVKDFENIEIGSSLAEIESRLGEPDGWVGGGILLPVYVLEDNSAVELVFKNDVTNEELETIYLYRGQEELILQSGDLSRRKD